MLALPLPLPLALVGGGDASELGDDDEPDQSDEPGECACECARECAGECGGESITLARRAAYSLIRALRVCRPCARAVPRESGETLRICAKKTPFCYQSRFTHDPTEGRKEPTYLVCAPLMAPPPGRTDEAIRTRAAEKPAAGRVRVHPEDDLDILAGPLDAYARIGAHDLDAAPRLDLVPLERARVERGEDDVRVVRVELAFVPAHGDLFAASACPPSPSSNSSSGGGGGDGGGREGGGYSGYVHAKRRGKVIIRPSPTRTATAACSCSSSRPSDASGDGTRIALAYSAPHAPGIRVAQAGGEERIGDDDSEGGAPVEREGAGRDGEGQGWVDEGAEVCGWELRAWGARGWREDELFFL